MKHNFREDGAKDENTSEAVGAGLLLLLVYPAQISTVWLAVTRDISYKLSGLMPEKAANLNEVDILGWTPLRWASQNGHIESIRLLVQNGADQSF
jgi:ankyrin repeat protein